MSDTLDPTAPTTVPAAVPGRLVAAPEGPVDGDARRPWRAGPLLGAFARGDVLTSTDVRTAERLGTLTGEPDESVHLAASLAVRALRVGSVCVDLGTVRELVAEDVADERALDDQPARTVGPGPDADGETDADAAGETAPDLPWPDLDAWRARLRASATVAVGPEGPADRPVRLVGDLVYLDRYWRDEQLVRSAVLDRVAAPLPVDETALAAALDRYFPPGASDAAQRAAAETAAHSRLTVLTGGPGTGKTTTVARLVATLEAAAGWSVVPRAVGGAPDARARDGGTYQRPALRVAFCAPTGKAAARLREAVDGELADLPTDTAFPPVTATTIHSLLRRRPGSTTRFRHDRTNRLPHDVVVVDESSMVSLPLLARLLDALRPDTRLVLVGDRNQLASVEVGAVLGDLVAWLDVDAAPAGPATPGPVPTTRVPCVVELTVRHRFGPELGALADAINAGDGERTLDLLRAGDDHVELVELTDGAVTEDDAALVRADVVAAGVHMVEAARAGDAAGALTALGTHRLLLAHRRGPAGVARWAALAQGWVAEATGVHDAGPWPLGRPLLVTTNDRTTGLANGDTGVVVDDGAGGVVVAFGEPDDPRFVRPHRLPAVEPVHAMTIHRAQGSQFDHVTVVLPSAASPLLTRELLYTAVTRAQRRVRVVGTADAVLAAVARRVRRASGLRPLDRA